jgi:hypothetical protein
MTTTGTATSRTATASCPAGKRLYGTGFELVGGHGQVAPTVVRPDAALTKVTVRADARRGFTGQWSLVAYATCAKPATHMRLVTSRPAPDTATTEACPAGTHVHGVGAEISGGSGGVTLDAMAPASDALIAARAGASENAPTDGKWTVTSYAICSS